MTRPRDEGLSLDAALSEIARFLAARAPFDALGPEELGEVAGQTEIEFHLAGAAILTEDGGPVTFLRVIHSGAVDILHDGRLLDLLGAGDMFGHAAMLSGLPPGFEARAAEDTLCYRIPVSVARPLLERVRQREIEVGAGGPTRQPVGRLIRSPDGAVRADGEHPRGRAPDDEGRRHLGDRRPARPRVRDRHRPRHPDQDRRRRAAAERAGGHRDDHAGVHGSHRTGRPTRCCSSCSSAASATRRW